MVYALTLPLQQMPTGAAPGGGDAGTVAFRLLVNALHQHFGVVCGGLLNGRIQPWQLGALSGRAQVFTGGNSGPGQGPELLRNAAQVSGYLSVDHLVLDPSEEANLCGEAGSPRSGPVAALFAHMAGPAFVPDIAFESLRGGWVHLQVSIHPNLTRSQKRRVNREVLGPLRMLISTLRTLVASRVDGRSWPRWRPEDASDLCSVYDGTVTVPLVHLPPMPAGRLVRLVDGSAVVVDFPEVIMPLEARYHEPLDLDPSSSSGEVAGQMLLPNFRTGGLDHLPLISDLSTLRCRTEFRGGPLASLLRRYAVALWLGSLDLEWFPTGWWYQFQKALTEGCDLSRWPQSDQRVLADLVHVPLGNLLTLQPSPLDPWD